MSEDIEHVGRGFRVFRVHGFLINFQKMKVKEGLCFQKLYEALADSTVKPAVGDGTKASLQKRYDNLPAGSAGERAVLKAIALWYQTKDVELAKVPIMNQEEVTNQVVTPFGQRQRILRLVGGASEVLDFQRVKTGRKS